jgi:hypothetical protein
MNEPKTQQDTKSAPLKTPSVGVYIDLWRSVKPRGSEISDPVIAAKSAITTGISFSMCLVSFQFRESGG